KLLESTAQDLLARAQRIHICGIKEIDSQFQRLLDEWPAFIFFQHPLAPAFYAVGHAAQADSGNLNAGGTKIGIFHSRLYTIRSDECSQAAESRACAPRNIFLLQLMVVRSRIVGKGRPILRELAQISEIRHYQGIPDLLQ